MEHAIFFHVAAADQLQSTEGAKVQAEQQQMQLKDELAELKATEGRLREKLAKREAKTLERKQVGPACHHCCFVGKANHMECWIPLLLNIQCLVYVIFTSYCLLTPLMNPKVKRSGLIYLLLALPSGQLQCMSASFVEPFL